MLVLPQVWTRGSPTYKQKVGLYWAGQIFVKHNKARLPKPVGFNFNRNLAQLILLLISSSEGGLLNDVCFV